MNIYTSTFGVVKMQTKKLNFMKWKKNELKVKAVVYWWEIIQQNIHTHTHM